MSLESPTLPGRNQLSMNDLKKAIPKNLFTPSELGMPLKAENLEDASDNVSDNTSDNVDVKKGGAKFDTGKVRVDLVPGEFVYAVAAVLTYGAIKYQDWNWAKGMRKGRLLAALGRHWIAYSCCEEIDDESGLPHTWHMATCLAMLISGELRGVAEEDRKEAVEAYQRAQAAFSKMKQPTKETS